MPIHMKFNGKLSKRDLVRAAKKTRELQAYRSMVRRAKAAYVSDTTIPQTPMNSNAIQEYLDYFWLVANGQLPMDAPPLSSPPNERFPVRRLNVAEVARKLERYV